MLYDDRKERLREFWRRSFSRVHHPEFAHYLKSQLRWLSIGAEGSRFDDPEMPRYAAHSTNVVRLEINVDKLCQLLECHQLFATDFRCLDRSSKNCIQRLFLHACARSLSASKPVKQ